MRVYILFAVMLIPIACTAGQETFDIPPGCGGVGNDIRFSGPNAIPIDDLWSTDAWSVNPDGGDIEIAARGPDGRRAMRLIFSYGDVQWGNVAREVTLLPNATAIGFDLYVNRAEPSSSLFLWLFEPDGDGHLARVLPDGKRLGQVARGWYHCVTPISYFRYQPRGNKVSQLLTANKLLIGMNGGDADVSISNIAFQTLDRETTMGFSRTENLHIDDGPKGRVVILADDFERLPGDSDPRVLADALGKHGYGATLLKSGDIADPEVLSRENFDCLVLPYGARYPYAAYDSIKAYLKSGGSFLSTGGYAFDQPCASGTDGRLRPVEFTTTAEELAKGEPGTGPLNTRYGKPGDVLGLDPEQIGVFDPCFHLKYAVGLRASDGQSAIPPSIEAELALEGYAACSMLGSNTPVFPEKWGRHVPLVEAVDDLGRPRGSVGSIAFNYAGPYAGSSWGFFGVTNTDLFADDGPMLQHIGAIMDALVRKTFLHTLKTDLACYRDGETVKVSCKLANLGGAEREVCVRFRVEDRDGRRVFSSDDESRLVRAGETADFGCEFAPGRFASDLYTVTAELLVGGKVTDSLQTGFAAYDDKVTASGLDLQYHDNYFRAGERPVLLSGTNHTGAIFYSGNENPLVWDRDLARMSENGLNVLRILHFSPFLADKPAYGAVKPIDLNVDRLPLRTERMLDALVQLCQRNRVVLFLSIHDWMDVELSDEELSAQRRFARLIAERYKDVPGFMIDIQNEPSLKVPDSARPEASPDVVRLWNDYLRERYGTDQALRDAWKHSPPEASIGSTPWRKGTDAWNDMRTFDADNFRNVLTNRWIEANYSGAKVGDPDVPVTVGFLQEYWALNKIACMDGLDFANMHSYNNIDVLKSDIKLFDRRFEGKSLSLGEFGALTDHDERTHGIDSADQDCTRYLQTGHYVFGEGGSLIASWCWKDMDDCVFPWGMVYQTGGPAKDLLKAYRNQSLLFRQVKPVYRPQEVFLVVPVDQMIGGQYGNSVRMLYRAVDDLLAAHADFGVIDDRHLDKLPPSAKVLVYPIPFNIPDETCSRLKSFVEGGGKLVITGDVSYDSLRRRTRTDRLKELCGVRFVSENYPGVSWPSDGLCINVEPVSAAKSDGLYVHRLGAGEVYYTPSPALGDATGLLARLGQPKSAVSRCTHAFVIPEEDGGRTYVMANPTSQPETAGVDAPGLTPVSFTLKANGVGMARYDRVGRLVALECQGSAEYAGVKMDVDGHFAIIACDGRDLPSSRELIVLPFGGGALDLSYLPDDMVVQTGDIAGGKWRVLSESADRKVSASGANAFDIRIIARRDGLPALARHLVSELMLR